MDDRDRRIKRPILSIEEVRAVLAECLPSVCGIQVQEVSPAGLVFTADPQALEIRPGGTVSGPAIFSFADVSAFLAVNAYLGKTPSTMLTSGSISFLEATEPGVLSAVVEALRIGRRTAVFTARVDDDRGRPVAMATLHFAFPSRAGISRSE